MSPGEYRQNAARCMAVAEQLPGGPSKQNMLEMAAAWMRLAAQAEKNLTTDLVYETPPPRPQQRPMAAQQQQQIQPKPDDKEKE
jgi:hypothetical protein